MNKTNKKRAYKRKHLRKLKTRRNKSISRSIKGGSSAFLPPTYADLPVRYAIPINEYSTDVQHAQIGARLDAPIKGGKKSKSRKSRKTLKKMKGGFIPFSWIKDMADPFAGTPNNFITTTGTESGGLMAYNLFTGNTSHNQSSIPVKIADTHLA